MSHSSTAEEEKWRKNVEKKKPKESFLQTNLTEIIDS